MALDQQKLFYDHQLFSIMSKCVNGGSQEESHSYDDHRSEEDGNWLALTLKYIFTINLMIIANA